MMLDDQPVGYVVGESHPDEFLFVSSIEHTPPLLEHLVVNLSREVDGESESVQVLSQVATIGVDSAILSEALTFNEVRMILGGQLAPSPKVIGTARIIGYLENGTVRTPRTSPTPGAPVFIAPDEVLTEFFSRPKDSALEVGTLLNRPKIGVSLDINGFRRHVAVIAQTGAGKSYLTGRLLECLVEMGGTILVLDPNSDYVQLRKVASDADTPWESARRTPFADRITLFRIPGVAGRRLGDDLVGPTREFTVQFSALEVHEICELAGIPQTAVRIRDAINSAATLLSRTGVDYGPRDLYEQLAILAGVEDEKSSPGFDALGRELHPSDDPMLRDGARRALAYIDGLATFGVWGFRDIPVDDLLQPQRLTVLDLAGADKAVAAYVADKTLREIWSRALTGRLGYPVFVVLEEAHNLVPPEGRGISRASRIINTIAAEGRKFKVFLIVVTQRPSRVHQDTLSQCGSQLLMRLTNPDDQRAVRAASEQMSEALLRNLPGLNTGEVIVVGPLTRIAATIQVGKRLSAEGGSDTDLASALANARGDAHVSGIAARRMEQGQAVMEPSQESWL